MGIIEWKNNAIYLNLFNDITIHISFNLFNEEEVAIIPTLTPTYTPTYTPTKTPKIKYNPSVAPTSTIAPTPTISPTNTPTPAPPAELYTYEALG